MKIKRRLRLFLLFSILLTVAHAQQKKYVLVIHGGAGTIERGRMTAELEQAYRTKLREALLVGYEVIKQHGSALDAVEKTIHVLEDSPLFNAGKGAVFTHEGKNELDAAIMDGARLRAGAVAGVTTIQNPISAARAVMEKSEHVLLAREGAEDFARQVGLRMVDPSYFYTKERWDGLQKALQHEAAQEKSGKTAARLGGGIQDDKFGTVGCVALDNQGNLAAGTSTGGMTNKKFGRIGDSPIIGAGTYANNASVAVSCTGWGEFYIRNVVAYDVAALMDYKNLKVQDAAETALAKVAKAGGNGGLIALDKEGNVAMPFNTSGMYRGAISATGEFEVEIYKDEGVGDLN
ncbi:isoaspartyl peptidase/L-asparaginase family protein [Olivibacter sp. CPCC 100613]|uniref:isoaspartyl peptidase/L-asparaginase family protein n=1 Tax=Olivibacter sp. CPCC 100613 TaxID=3079931 RepID=UPI002FF50073